MHCMFCQAWTYRILYVHPITLRIAVKPQNVTTLAKLLEHLSLSFLSVGKAKYGHYIVLSCIKCQCLQTAMLAQTHILHI